MCVCVCAFGCCPFVSHFLVWSMGEDERRDGAVLFCLVRWLPMMRGLRRVLCVWALVWFQYARALCCLQRSSTAWPAQREKWGNRALATLFNVCCCCWFVVVRVAAGVGIK